jgi:hypothetical protein
VGSSEGVVRGKGVGRRGKFETHGCDAMGFCYALFPSPSLLFLVDKLLYKTLKYNARCKIKVIFVQSNQKMIKN